MKPERIGVVIDAEYTDTVKPSSQCHADGLCHALKGSQAVLLPDWVRGAASGEGGDGYTYLP